MSIEIIFGLMAGLSLFLYGMQMMSDGLQKVAGAKLRNVLAACTKNKLIGLIVGVVVTAIIQSSSTTTVLVVSFVNAGLMNLSEAVGIILGANIGTTVTGQLLALNLTAFAPVFAIVGVVMIMFFKKTSIRKTGEIILGFGMLLIGMEMMSDAMEGLKEMPAVVNLLSSFDNPFIGILVGILVTAVLQSSSATIGILMVLTSQGMVSLPLSLYIILGCNIGSCVTAMLASLNGKKDAKRAALIHLVVNVVGMVVNAVVLMLFMDQIIAILGLLTKGVPNEAINGINDKLAKDVANANTLFKTFQVLVIFPFTALIVKLTYLLVPGSDEKVDRQHLKYIGEHAVYSPTTAIPQATREIVRMGTIAFENLALSMEGLLGRDPEKAEQVYGVEHTINYVNEEITKYLVRANQLSLPVGDRKLLAGLFHVVSDIERIGDHAANLADFTKTMVEDDVSFSEEGERELKEMFELTQKLLNYSMEIFSKKTEEHLKEILDLEDKVDQMERQFQKNHIRRLTNNECTPESGMIFSDLISNLERVADHGTNIAFSILEEGKDETELERAALADKEEL